MSRTESFLRRIYVSLSLTLAALTANFTGRGNLLQPDRFAYARESGGETYQNLELLFLDPPAAARPAVYWCWLNGVVDKSALKQELAELAGKGIRGVYVFDIGARSWDKPLPAGPAFLSHAWLEAFAEAVRQANKLGMEVGLITSSSWNAGGPWIPSELASMALYRVTVLWEGPGYRRERLPLPPVPAQAPRDETGRLSFYRDVAVLAMPDDPPRKKEFFVFRLLGTDLHLVDRTVFYQAPSRADQNDKPVRQVKEFAVWLSSTSDEPEAFQLVLRGTLRPEIGPQEFRFKPTTARYAMLELLESHLEELSGYDLAEWELYNQNGLNVASMFTPDGTRTGAALLWWGSQASMDGPGSAACIHDAVKDQPKGVWSSAEPAPLEIPHVDKVIDLTDKLDSEGFLTWEVPPGRWRIIRYGCTNTGQRLVLPSPHSGGLVLDHLNPDATAFHFHYIISRLKEHLGPELGGSLRQLYACSYEVRGATWTPKFLDEFRQRRGYDMRRYLPALDGYIIGTWGETRRFLHDFRKTLGELLVDGFYRKAAEICGKHGLRLCAEAGGPGLPLHQVPVDALQAQGAVDIPRGEFWIEHDIWVVKETACAANIYGKKQVDMEAFTSWRHWQDGPWQLKPIADRAFAEGANHFTFHTSAHRPGDVKLPGWVYHAGTHFSPHIAWWPLAGAFVDYIARCSALLQYGQYLADVCYYYGDGGFNYVPPKHVDPRLGLGYDYDVCNEEVLLTRADIHRGRLVFWPDQTPGYAVLVLPDRREISPAVLSRLAELVDKGLIIIGPPPERSVSLSGYPQCDQQLQEVVRKLWGPHPRSPQGERRVGQGRVIWGKTVREALLEQGVLPDFWLEDPRARGEPGSLSGHACQGWPLDFVHRRGLEADVYFIWNKTNHWQNRWVSFRTEGNAPELWDPAIGSMIKAPIWRPGETRQLVYLQLPPRGTIFAIFPRHAKGNSQSKVPQTRITAVQKNGRSELVPSDTEPSILVRPSGCKEEPLLIFREPGAYLVHLDGGPPLSVQAAPQVQELAGPWRVQFHHPFDTVTEEIFDKLIPWNEHSNPAIRYFSGLATYEINFELEQNLSRGQRLILSLGEVHFLAELVVNNHLVGTLWTAPWECDITPWVRPGTNTLKIRVANDWNNRLVGDAGQPPERRSTETNIPWSISWRRLWKDTPLQPAGLIGPVRLLCLESVALTTPPAPSR